jgi:hypothetical protein
MNVQLHFQPAGLPKSNSENKLCNNLLLCTSANSVVNQTNSSFAYFYLAIYQPFSVSESYVPLLARADVFERPHFL